MSDDKGILKRLSAFTTNPEGGNPAGVWLGAKLPRPDEMLRIAREVGFSETAFAEAVHGNRFEVRYYSVEAEVSFCGHATIATGVMLGERFGEGIYEFATAVGDVPVVVERLGDRFVASLTSVTPQHHAPDETLLQETLASLGLGPPQLDPAIPPAVAYAGAWHIVVAVAHSNTLATMQYDFDRLKAIMLGNNLTTVQLIWRERDDLIHARNPFPVGGVVEDPATGAAAAALGGYLRDAGLITPPTSFEIRQGEVMGRPSLLQVTVPPGGGITVTGSAVSID